MQSKLTIGTVVLINGECYMLDVGNTLGENVFVPITINQIKNLLPANEENWSKAVFYATGEPVQG